MAGVIVWGLTALILLLGDRRWSGSDGRRRLLALDDWQARNLHDGYAPAWPTRALVAAGITAAVLAAIVVAVGSPVTGGGCVLVAALSLGAARSRSRTAPQVVAVLGSRPLAPARERSVRRRRRQRQLGAASVVLFVAAGATASFRDDLPWSVGLASAFIVASFVALFALAWASVWRYGDEERGRSA